MDLLRDDTCFLLLLKLVILCIYKKIEILRRFEKLLRCLSGKMAPKKLRGKVVILSLRCIHVFEISIQLSSLNEEYHLFQEYKTFYLSELQFFKFDTKTDFRKDRLNVKEISYCTLKYSSDILPVEKYTTHSQLVKNHLILVFCSGSGTWRCWRRDG
jgi:hypothetical protein